MNAVFTIVAKNYLPLAMTLGDTVKKHHPDLPFFIFLADEIDGAFVPSQVNYPVIEVKDIGISNLYDLAFKYNVTEFCTAVKPYCIDYLFEKSGFDKVIYFDPDIYVFNSLDRIYTDLSDNFIVITPHFVTPEIHYSGTTPEGLILFVGIYNLGFVAVNNSADGKRFIQWWKDRLRDKSYADQIEGLHTDQKWIDFVPALFQKGVKISYDLGYNMSFWNLHERFLVEENGTYMVHHTQGELAGTPLTFFHFAGFDTNYTNRIHKNHPQVGIDEYPTIKGIMKAYKQDLLAHTYSSFIKMPYKYNSFTNGIPIIQFQRRVYKQLSRTGWNFENPFATGPNTFYRLMEKNRMLVKKGSVNIDRMNERTMAGFEGKIQKLNFVFKVLKSVLGIEKYALLSKFFLRYFRPENQLFLIHENVKYKFINETQK